MKQKNDENDYLITIVGTKMATKGLQFAFHGPTQVCKECKLFRVCMTNLEPKRLYEIAEIRKVEHKCPVHEDGAKTVVVIEPPQDLVVKSRFAVEGVIFTLQAPGVGCPNQSCEHWDHCNNGYIRTGDRVRIVQKLHPISCQAGKKLSLVKVSRVH